MEAKKVVCILSYTSPRLRCAAAFSYVAISIKMKGVRRDLFTASLLLSLNVNDMEQYEALSLQRFYRAGSLFQHFLRL
jgi:hypothetical protein